MPPVDPTSLCTGSCGTHLVMCGVKIVCVYTFILYLRAPVHVPMHQPFPHTWFQSHPLSMSLLLLCYDIVLILHPYITILFLLRWYSNCLHVLICIWTWQHTHAACTCRHNNHRNAVESNISCRYIVFLIVLYVDMLNCSCTLLTLILLKLIMFFHLLPLMQGLLLNPFIHLYSLGRCILHLPIIILLLSIPSGNSHRNGNLPHHHHHDFE